MPGFTATLLSTCCRRACCIYWAIPLFNYTPLQMAINGVRGGGGGGGGGIGNMSRGVVI